MVDCKTKKKEMVNWSNSPQEILEMIAVRVFSAVELKRFHSICKTWRSSTNSSVNLISTRPLIKLDLLVITVVIPLTSFVHQVHGLDLQAYLSRASFFRVTLSSSSSNKGWLIKSDVDINLGTLHLINPLSRVPLIYRNRSIDLLKFTITEVQEGFLVKKSLNKVTVSEFKKVILVGGDRVIGICGDGKIRYWNGKIWTRIKDQVGEFSDIIVYKGLTYALDSKGIVWSISSSLSIVRYRPALVEDGCRDMSLVGCCGELYIVDRLLERNVEKIRTVHYTSCRIHDDFGNTPICEDYYKRKDYKTVGFKVYKVDEDSVTWVEAKSIKDNAFVMATDTCFSVVAHEYYGCFPNSIYFFDEEDKESKVFKLEDGSITRMNQFEQSCFLMLDPSVV